MLKNIIQTAIQKWVMNYGTEETKAKFWNKLKRKRKVESREESTGVEEVETLDIDEYEASETKGEEEKKASVPEIVQRLVNTFLVILTRTELEATVTVDDSSFAVKTYVFPPTFWEIARARRVYLSESARTVCKPIFKWKLEDEVDTEELLTPLQVKMFFEQLNKHQTPETTVAVEGPDARFEECVTLSDLRAFMQDGMVCDLNNEGTINEAVSQLLNIEIPFPSETVNDYKPLHERSVAKWLLSTKGSNIITRTSPSKEE